MAGFQFVPAPHLDEESEDEHYESCYGMFSESGDDECGEVLSRSTTWEELFANIERATHREMSDTVVRDHMVESFDQSQIDAGRESYAQYEHRVGGCPGPGPPTNPGNFISYSDRPFDQQGWELHQQRVAAYQTELQEYRTRYAAWCQQRRQQQMQQQ